MLYKFMLYMFARFVSTTFVPIEGSLPSSPRFETTKAMATHALIDASIVPLDEDDEGVGNYPVEQ